MVGRRQAYVAPTATPRPTALPTATPPPGATATPRPTPRPRPAAPEWVKLTRANRTVTATWPAVSGATSYRIIYNTGSDWITASMYHPRTSITIIGADNAKPYTFRVRALNAHSSSDWDLVPDHRAVQPATDADPDADSHALAQHVVGQQPGKSQTKLVHSRQILRRHIARLRHRVQDRKQRQRLHAARHNRGVPPHFSGNRCRIPGRLARGIRRPARCQRRGGPERQRATDNRRRAYLHLLGQRLQSVTQHGLLHPDNELRYCRKKFPHLATNLLAK